MDASPFAHNGQEILHEILELIFTGRIFNAAMKRRFRLDHGGSIENDMNFQQNQFGVLPDMFYGWMWQWINTRMKYCSLSRRLDHMSQNMIMASFDTAMKVAWILNY